MTTVHFDTPISDDERRARLYEGDIFVYSAVAASGRFCTFARAMAVDAFGDDDPEHVQHKVDRDNYIEVLKDLKPRFIHHPESKAFITQILSELGCDLDDIYFDVPRLRTSTSDGYLTTGIAYAWHPHRDTWYSAPSTQINVWMPVSELSSSNTIAFHPKFFGQVVENDSHRYNYYEWNKKFRAAASNQKDKDDRPLPGPVSPVEMESQIRIVCPVGGVILFSGAQLHSSVPNDSGGTRLSIDFRTVSAKDILASKGAPTPDVACTGSNIRDFLSANNYSQIPAEVVARFNDGTEDRGDLRYTAQESAG